VLGDEGGYLVRTSWAAVAQVLDEIAERSTRLVFASPRQTP
jgi:hypothetical protein